MMNTKKRSFTSLSATASDSAAAQENDVTSKSSLQEPTQPAVQQQQQQQQQPNKEEPAVVEIPPVPTPKLPEPILYLEEGLFAVNKPLGWTSQDVVGKIRNILEQDAKSRNCIDVRKKKRKPWMKVGHGGTLDPLATGTLVIGVGKGTKLLQKYLIGSKGYQAEITLGYQTTTLDSEESGSVVLRKSYDHVTSYQQINDLLQSKFLGKIQQIPPIFSALKRDGKKLYQLAREDGLTADDIQIESRQVIIYKLELSNSELLDLDLESENKQSSQQPIEKFSINVECGGGTYIRSLVRDIGTELGTCATMTKLERTKQGHFLLNEKDNHCVQYQINDSNNDGNIDDYINDVNVDDKDDDDKVETNNDSKIETDKETEDVEKQDNANATTTTSSEDKKTTSTNKYTKSRIDKRKDCNWTIETIIDAIRSSRERLSLLADDDDGLEDDKDDDDDDDGN